MKSIIIFLALLAILALLGCLAPSKEQNGLSKATENISAPDMAPSANSGQESSKIGIFVEKCAGKGLSDYNLIFTCLPEVKVDTNNLRVADCVSLDVNNFIGECPGPEKITCDFFLAMMKNKCVSELAKAKNDISVCRSIGGINAEACEAEFNGKAEEYAKKQMGKMEEIRKLAVEQNDETLCRQLGEGMWYEVCVTDVAVKRKDTALCEGFKYGSGLCEREVEKEIKKSEVEEKALRLNDEKVCSEIPQIGLAELCVTKVAVKRKDASLCKTLEYGADFCKAEVEKEAN